MKKLLYKEIRLTANPLSYLFILFSAMTMIPGYPILVGGFFVCLGIFQTFQSGRENNDTLYTALLPIKKRDVVSARYGFVLAVELTAFAVCALLTALRMLFLSGAAVYTDNAMMNANFAYLGYLLILFGVFNGVFVTGFYKTAYAIGKPFLAFGIVSFLVLIVAETVHHLPGCGGLNSPGFEPIQLAVFLAGVVIFTGLTVIGLKKSQSRFAHIDL